MLRILIIVVCTCASVADAFAQYGSYPPEQAVDIAMGPTLKTRPASWLWYYLDAGIELPLGENRYLDLNLGVHGVGLRPRATIPGGGMFSGGIIFPLTRNSPYSVFYWEPEFFFGKIKQEHTTYNSWAGSFESYHLWTTMFLVNNHFGYRHVNPNSRFFYEISIGIGFGKLTMDEPPTAPNYSYEIPNAPYSFLLTRSYFYSDDERTISPVAFSTRFSIGTVLRRKPKKQ